jgi:hypothetical protein
MKSGMKMNGNYVIKVIFKNLMEPLFPSEGNTFSTAELMSMSVDSSFYAADISQYTAKSQYFIEPKNYWNANVSLKNNRLSPDITTESYYYGSILQRIQEKE